MANEEHPKILQQGVEVWNRWREQNPFIYPDLREADLREEDLRLAQLSGAALVQADLYRADLSGAYLSGAYLIETNLYGTELSEADLCGADLRGAELSVANLRGTDLCGADLSGAYVGWTVFGAIDLSNTKGLDTVSHQGPSIIGIDTIYKSGGNIPELFLRGSGVPDDMIAYIRSIAGAIQFYSCFISYSTKNQDFAERLHADLQDKGVRCWFAPKDVQGGQKLHEQIDQAIRLHDKLLLILSEDSMDSEWVKSEIYRARQNEIKQKRRKLFPISLVDFSVIREWTAFDAEVGKDMAREVREYFIPDFSNWKDHDSYQKAFDRLLRDLKAEAGWLFGGWGLPSSHLSNRNSLRILHALAIFEKPCYNQNTW